MTWMLRMTQERLAYLRTGYPRWRLPELTARFNARFGADATSDQIRNALLRNKIRSGRPPGMATGEHWVTWSPAMITWLKRHRARWPIGECTERINARFGTAFKPHSIHNACMKHGIKTGRDGCFEPGLVPWNKGQKHNVGGRSVETRFRPGNTPHTWQPIGAYRQDSKGCWWVKWRDEQTAGQSRHNWVEVHKLTYRDHRGPIPRGHCVVFLDGNMDHCLDPANLEAIPRAVLVRLNQMGWGQITHVGTRRAMLALARLTAATHRTASDIGLSRVERRGLCA